MQPGMMAVLANRSRLERELGGAAERISSIRKAREEAGVPRDFESGQRLHDALCANPAAKL